MNEDIKELYKIDEELDNSKYEKEDFIKALDDIYERFEGYYGIKTEMEEWLIDENGEVINKTFDEIENFYLKLIEKIYEMLIIKEYERIFNNEVDKNRTKWYKEGKKDAYNKIIKIVEELL